MLEKFLNKAKQGKSVYINSVYDFFKGLPEKENLVINCVLTLLENDEKRVFKLNLPLLEKLNNEETIFVRNYVLAEIYNILSSLGGKKMVFYVDKKNRELKKLVQNLDDDFSINGKRSERTGYGRCINVIDRMLESICPGEKSFHFEIEDISRMPLIEEDSDKIKSGISIFKKAVENLENKVICGIDVGGTDIKAVLVKNGKIICFKEYDWFPTNFKYSKELVNPICLIVKLMKAKLTLDELKIDNEILKFLRKMVDAAFEKTSSDEQMIKSVSEIENYFKGNLSEIDSIGLCFPDVVVKNKIVGGEVYKTRGIRNNKEIDYEKDFLELTSLDVKLKELVKKGGSVKIINDGPMASFTAAVEIADSETYKEIENGIFAHTLGTELGTGWVKNDGNIPDIPLEVYNFIIDLGSFPEKEFEADDLRSINNFNTGLPGTLQKYCSQSGVFRLALKYFPKERADLYKELFDKGFVAEKEINGIKGFYVPTRPKDQRKPFLEFMMNLPERENDKVNERIWMELGEFLAVTYIETKKILKTETDARFLFGRLVKNKRCFDLICKGAKNINKDVIFVEAGSGLVNTHLMKDLDNDKNHTVAQFAQSIGAVYFANC